jgi:hypothetical protein
MIKTIRLQLCLIRNLNLGASYMGQAAPAFLPAKQTLRTVTFLTQDQRRTILEGAKVHQEL